MAEAAVLKLVAQQRVGQGASLFDKARILRVDAKPAQRDNDLGRALAGLLPVAGKAAAFHLHPGKAVQPALHRLRGLLIGGKGRQHDGRHVGICGVGLVVCQGKAAVVKLIVKQAGHKLPAQGVRLLRPVIAAVKRQQRIRRAGHALRTDPVNLRQGLGEVITLGPLLRGGCP